MAKFETGKTYSVRSVGDHNCIFTVEVLKRTEKQITAKVWNETKKLGVKVVNGVERCFPMGHYSMAPCVTANHSQALKRDWEQ